MKAESHAAPGFLNAFTNISSLAVDSNGRLWVAEATDARPSGSAATGCTAPGSSSTPKEFFGSTLYGGLGGAIDPADPNVMVGNGCEWHIDPVTGHATCVSGHRTRDARTGSAVSRPGRMGEHYLFVSPGWFVFGLTPYITGLRASERDRLRKIVAGSHFSAPARSRTTDLLGGCHRRRDRS